MMMPPPRRQGSGRGGVASSSSSASAGAPSTAHARFQQQRSSSGNLGSSRRASSGQAGGRRGSGGGGGTPQVSPAVTGKMGQQKKITMAVSRTLDTKLQDALSTLRSVKQHAALVDRSLPLEDASEQRTWQREHERAEEAAARAAAELGPVANFPVPPPHDDGGGGGGAFGSEDEQGFAHDEEDDDNEDGPGSHWRSKLQIAETVMRKLYKRNKELEQDLARVRAGGPQAGAPSSGTAAASGAIGTADPPSSSSHTSVGAARDGWGQTVDYQRENARLAFELQRMQSNEVVLRAEEATNEAARLREELASARTEFQKLAKVKVRRTGAGAGVNGGKGGSTMAAFDDGQSAASSLLVSLSERLSKEQQARDTDVAMMSMRLLRMEEDLCQKFVENRLLCAQKQEVQAQLQTQRVDSEEDGTRDTSPTEDAR